MRLVAVSVSGLKPLEVNGKVRMTGILKAPVPGRVRMRRLGIEGDAQYSKVHGGAYKAVYAYAAEHYDWWRRELGSDLPYGTFGENLVIEGFFEDALRIGDKLRIGPALAQVTEPRGPCATFGARMGDPAFPKRFLESRRIGLYLRVLEEGEIGAGDPVEIAERSAEPVTGADMIRWMHFERADTASLRRLARLPGISPVMRGSILKRLAKRTVRNLFKPEEPPAGA